MNLLVDIQYFPSIILYKNLNKFSNIIFEQYEYYQKMSFRNRCRIAGADGPIDLSVPLEKGRDQKSLVKDVRISGSVSWQGQHWKTILSCYSRSPWFEFYRDDLQQLYGRPFVFLLDWNLSCFEWSLRMLNMPVNSSLTDSFQKTYQGEEWVDWRGRLLPKNREPRSGPKASIAPETLAAAKDPEVPEHSFAPGTPNLPENAAPVKYRQVFEDRIGFLPGLSILDLLFCEGKNAKGLLI